EDGAVTVRGRLTAEVGALLVQALAAAREAVYPKNVPAGTCAPGVPQETPTMEQQQADALALLAETALHHGIDPGAPGERYQVVVHVDAQVLADADQPGQSVLEDGARVPAGTSQRLACDASRVVMRHDVRFGQGHHLRHWAHGGPTTLSNLALLCRRHHRAVHEEGYRVERQADGELQFRSPGGLILPEVPPSPDVPADVAQRLGATYDAGASCTHTRVASSGWFGERMHVA